VGDGSDSGLMEPIAKYMIDKYKKTPKNWLVDAGYVCETGLGVLENLGIQVLMPVPERTRKKHGAGIPLPMQSPVMNRWVERMNTVEATELYKCRASTAEFSNASTRNKGFYQFKVRGRLKAQATSILFAITHNIERIISMIRSGCISSVFN